ncbi:MAG: DUF3368 domain-containing protein [Cyclobacteriaceae bacterium]|nr:DUF3368 domain-containing protein [Cyclobacteriaceae bacterium HetDA_MAG_MS6]
MPNVVISDTGCLIALSNIGEIGILQKIYDHIYTTPVVAEEFGEELPGWIEQLHPRDDQKQQLLELQVDKGEASAINLALELSADLVILDDLKARNIAERLGSNITGTLGVGYYQSKGFWGKLNL